MKKVAGVKSLILLLRNSVQILMENPIIFYPLCITVFIQLLVLELIYFMPRWPLSVFFGPIIQRIFGESYLHYPFNFKLLPTLFFNAQIAIYLIAGAFLSAMAISMIAAINNDQKTNLRRAFKETLPRYIHIFIYVCLVFLTVWLFQLGFSKLLIRAAQIKSQTGLYFIIKTIFMKGGAYFNLLIDIVTTTLYVFVLPVIVIEKAKIHKAIFLNFKNLFSSFWMMLGVVFITTLLYTPVLMLRYSIAPISQTAPYLQGLLIVLSAFAKLIIEGIVLVASTTYYLLKKESK